LPVATVPFLLLRLLPLALPCSGRSSTQQNRQTETIKEKKIRPPPPLVLCLFFIQFLCYFRSLSSDWSQLLAWPEMLKLPCFVTWVWVFPPHLSGSRDPALQGSLPGSSATGAGSTEIQGCSLRGLWVVLAELTKQMCEGQDVTWLQRCQNRTWKKSALGRNRVEGSCCSMRCCQLASGLSRASAPCIHSLFKLQFQITLHIPSGFLEYFEQRLFRTY